MRRFLMILALVLIAGCGGGEPSTGPTMLQSVGNAITGSSHVCATPVPSGSAEQVACHEAAKVACGEDGAPNRVDFEQPTTGRYAGQFLVKGYSCV